MKIFLFNAGLFYADGGAMFGAVPRTAWGRRYEADHLNRCVLAMQIGLVRVEDRILLIDTGVGTKHLERLSRSYYAFHQLTDPAVTLARLGIRPDDVTDVILTHLHFDHCGGTTRMDDLGRIVATYPRARVHVSRAQLDEADIARRIRHHNDAAPYTLILMTDGVSDPKFETDAGLKNPALWQALWQELKTPLAEPAPDIALLDWLDFWSRGNHDDRTIALLIPNDQERS